MAEVDKATLDAALAALLVNNVSGDIEANELLAQFRNILDSYGNMQALTTGQVPMRAATAGVWENWDFNTAIQSVSQARWGRSVNELGHLGGLTLSMDPTNANGPGRKFRFLDPANQTISLPDATTVEDVGKFWIIENASRAMLTLDPIPSDANINDGTDVIVLPGQTVVVRVADFITTGTVTHYEAYVLTRVSGSLTLGRGQFQTVVFDNLVQAAVNESGAIIPVGTPLRTGTSATNTRRLFERSDLTQSQIVEFVAFNEAAAASGSIITGLSKGVITDYTLPIFNNRSAEPLTQPITAQTQLYWDETNDRYDDTDVDTNVIPLAEVIRSDYRLPNTAPNITADIALNNVSNVNSFLNQTAIMTANPPNTLTLTDLRNGQPDSDAIPQGGEFAFIVPADGGALNITLAGGSSNGFFDHLGGAVPGNLYTLGNRDVPQGIVVYRDNNDWRLRQLNHDTLENDLLFDLPTRTHGLLTTLVGQTVVRVNNLEDIPVTALETATTSFQPTTAAEINRLFVWEIDANDRQFILPNPADATFGIPAGTFGRIWIKNDSAFWMSVRNHQADLIFEELSADTIYLRPFETREFILYNEAGVGRIYIVGPVIYPFTVISATLGGNWSLAADTVGISANIISIDSPNFNRLQINIPGVRLRNAIAIAQFRFTGTSAGNFGQLAAGTNSHLNLVRTGATTFAGNDVSVLNLSGFEVHYEQNFGEILAGDSDYFEVTGGGLTDITAENIVFRGDMVLKPA